MASTLPVRSNAYLLAPLPFLLLFLLLLLSLFLALSLLHINDLLSHSLSSPPPLVHFLPPLLPAFLSPLLHFHQHYLAFLLSPCPIFILANLIVFTLFLSVYFSSSSASSSSAFVPAETLDYHDAGVSEPSLPSHDDFFLASPPPQHFVLSYDPPEDYHVLSFNTNYDEPAYYSNVQSYNKSSKNWEKVKGVSINPNTINGVKDKVMMVEKVQSTVAVAATAAASTYKMMNVDQGKLVEKGLQENRFEEKASRSTKAAVYSSPTSQMVVINMEHGPATRRTRILATNTSMQASHPPLVPLPPLQHPTKAAPPPSNASNMLAQRPPSSPRVKKSPQSTGSSTSDGRYEASKTLLDGEKQASKPCKPQKKPCNMVRSHSDQRLSQRDSSSEIATVVTSPSCFTNRPHMQRAQSLRNSNTPNTITSVSSNKPHIMQRAQSLRGHCAPDDEMDSPSHGQVTRSPSFSTSLDGLSDSEANQRFSDFIAHHFALMKKELD